MLNVPFTLSLICGKNKLNKIKFPRVPLTSVTQHKAKEKCRRRWEFHGEIHEHLRFYSTVRFLTLPIFSCSRLFTHLLFLTSRGRTALGVARR